MTGLLPKVRIVSKGLPSNTHTFLRKENGVLQEVPNVRRVSFSSLGAESKPLQVTITLDLVDVDINADALLSLDTVRTAAEHHGYLLVKKGQSDG